MAYTQWLMKISLSSRNVAMLNHLWLFRGGVGVFLVCDCLPLELRTCLNAIQMERSIPRYLQLNLIHLLLYTDAVCNQSAATSGGLLNPKQQYLRLVFGYQVDDSSLTEG